MTARFLQPVFAGLLALTVNGTPISAQTAPETKPETSAEKFDALLLEIQTLQMRKRYLDALTKLEEADKLEPGKAQIHNIRGSIYLSSQMRDLTKARAEFKKAQEIEPEAMPSRFNLAEADYIQGKFAAGARGFADLLVKFPKIPTSLRHMVIFKQIVCQVKQGRLSEATKLMNDSFTFMDDTPAYYFCKAVIALQAKDEKTGNEWLAKAQRIFKKHETSAYLDTLIEGHYIVSIGLAKDTDQPEAQ